MEITKEIEAKYAKGDIVQIDGENYIIHGMCKYYKKLINGVWHQFDLALYIHKADDETALEIIYTNFEQ